MNGEGCWSTVVCTPQERTALGLTGQSEWLLHCRLSAGHRGNHATDASSHPRVDRRLWLEWNDFDDRAQSLIERNPCTMRSPQGAGCLFYEGHGGGHFFAPSNGHAPTAMQAPPPGAPPTGRAPHPPSAPEPPTSRPPAPPRAAGAPRSTPASPPPPPRQPTSPGIGAVPQRGSGELDGSRRRPAQPSPGQSGPIRPVAPRPSPPTPADPADPAPAVRPEATPQPVGAHAGPQGYRLGRRSTDTEPPADMTRHASSRHRLPEPDDEGPTAAPAAHAEPNQPPREPVSPGAIDISGTGRASGGADGVDGHGGEVAAALRDVAAALEKLASAMRPSEGPAGRR